MGNPGHDAHRFTGGEHVPAAVVERLLKVGSGSAPFASLGSVGDFALAGDAGFQVLGPVSGLATGFDVPAAAGYTEPGSFRELQYWGSSSRSAFEAAVEDLRAQARAIGADTVVAIKMEVEKDIVWRSEVLTFVLVGNALRSAAGVLPGPVSQVALSNLSAADHWALQRCGSRPLGLAFTSRWYVASMGWDTVRTMRSARFAGRGRLAGRLVAPSRPLADVSDAVRGVRRQTLAELRAQAESLGAAGIVNTDLQVQVTHEAIVGKRRRRVASPRYGLSATALATAVSPLGSPPLAPRPIVQLGGTTN